MNGDDDFTPAPADSTRGSSSLDDAAGPSRLLTQGEALVLSKLSTSPKWARSFSAQRTVLNALVDLGLVARVAPPGGKGRNMVVLTGAGALAKAGGR